MNTLLDKIRKAREFQVKVSGVTFTALRPTDLDALSMRYQSVEEALHGVVGFIVDWDGVNEIDLIPGGSNIKAAFDQDVCMEYLMDRPEMWTPIVEGVRNAYEAYQKQKHDNKKKS